LWCGLPREPSLIFFHEANFFSTDASVYEMSPWRGSKLAFCRAKLMKKEPRRRWDYWAAARPKIKSRPGANFVLYERKNRHRPQNFVIFAQRSVLVAQRSSLARSSRLIWCCQHSSPSALTEWHPCSAWLGHTRVFSDFDNWHTQISVQNTTQNWRHGRLPQFQADFLGLSKFFENKFSKVSWYTFCFVLYPHKFS